MPRPTRSPTSTSPVPKNHQQLAGPLLQRVTAGRETGLAPQQPQAAAVVDELAAAYAEHVGSTDGPSFRRWLADLLEASSDQHYERYWYLLALTSSWP